MSPKSISKVDWTKYTLFQQKVLKAVLKIPKGEVLTYKQVAAKIGSPDAARAVGGALKANRDAPVVPCHRVVAGGGIGGYSGRGGIKGKRKLLRSEGCVIE